jgi:hypothetical protein
VNGDERQSERERVADATPLKTGHHRKTSIRPHGSWMGVALRAPSGQVRRAVRPLQGT